MIKRPKKVARSEKQIFTSEQYQQYAEEQFNNIYDFLTPTVEKFKVKDLRGDYEATVFLIKSGNTVEVKAIIPIDDLEKAHQTQGGMFLPKNIDAKYRPKIIDDEGNVTLRNAYGYFRDSDFGAGYGDGNNNPNYSYGMVGIYPYQDKTNIQLIFWNLEYLTQTVDSTTLYCHFTYITE